MIIRYTFDIHTQQPVYAVCEASTGTCLMLTTSITTAINKIKSNK
jgi:hypothetical protein